MPSIQGVPSIFIGFILLAAFFVMGKAADLIVYSLVNLGKIFRVHAFALSFVLLGLTTSLPEMVIGVYAVFDKVPRLSFGNLLGGVILLLTLVMGLNGMMLGKIAVDGKFARFSMCKILPRIPWCGRLGIHDLGIIAALLLAPALLLIDGGLSRLDGGVLVILYLFFVWYYLRTQTAASTLPPAEEKHPALLSNSIKFAIGAIALIAVARIVVYGSEVLLTRLDIPPFLFGLLALAVGTNLPELTIMMRARKSAGDISAGNVLGSAAANIFILGLLSMIAPLSGFGRYDILFSGWMLAIVAITLMIFFRTRNELSRTESLLLILLYIMFFVTQSILSP